MARTRGSAYQATWLTRQMSEGDPNEIAVLAAPAAPGVRMAGMGGAYLGDMGGIDLGEMWDRIKEAAKHGLQVAIDQAKEEILHTAQGTTEYQQIEAYIMQQRAKQAAETVRDNLPMIGLGLLVLYLATKRGR